MTVALGVMQVPAGEDGDSNRRYLNGTLPDGGLWTALRRLSDHDHTGALNGAPISVASLPDGSITIDKLDPTVLAPYALVDGSKPFTGQVTMEQDAVLRDTLYFGQQGSAAPADADLSRAGPGVLTTTSQLRLRGLVGPLGDRAAQALLLYDAGGDNWAGLQGDPAANVSLHVGTSAATRRRVTLNASTGALAPGTDGGQSLGWSDTRWLAAYVLQLLSTNLVQAPPAENLTLQGDQGRIVSPSTDARNYLGFDGLRWITVYSQNGVNQSSAASTKAGVAPLDLDASMEAVRTTVPVEFDYATPPPGPEGYELPDDPEQAEAVLYQRLAAAPQAAAAAHQAGVVLGHPEFACDPAFATGEGQTNPSNSFGVLLAAVKQMDRRLAALEGV